MRKTKLDKQKEEIGELVEWRKAVPELEPSDICVGIMSEALKKLTFPVMTFYRLRKGNKKCIKKFSSLDWYSNIKAHKLTIGFTATYDVNHKIFKKGDYILVVIRAMNKSGKKVLFEKREFAAYSRKVHEHEIDFNIKFPVLV